MLTIHCTPLADDTCAFHTSAKDILRKALRQAVGLVMSSCQVWMRCRHMADPAFGATYILLSSIQKGSTPATTSLSFPAPWP